MTMNNQLPCGRKLSYGSGILSGRDNCSFRTCKAVRTGMAGSRGHYPFYRNTFGIQFVES